MPVMVYFQGEPMKEEKHQKGRTSRAQAGSLPHDHLELGRVACRYHSSGGCSPVAPGTPCRLQGTKETSMVCLWTPHGK